MSAAPTDVLLSDAIEAEARRVMAQRAGLKTQPGTHGRQADLLVDVDYLLDRWLEVVADDGRTAAPHG
jgi:hypothetical protein